MYRCKIFIISVFLFFGVDQSLTDFVLVLEKVYTWYCPLLGLHFWRVKSVNL